MPNKVAEYQIQQYAIHSNFIINGGCQVAQRTAPNLSTTSQYGKVDRFRVHGAGTAVSAGTINQDSASPAVGRTGNALHISGATITGTGQLFIKYRVEAKDALEFKNQIASFSCAVHHDVGSSINYLITIRKPTVADNFASVTDIGNSGSLSVLTGTASVIKLEALSMGDTTNGVEIEIRIDCGAVTTKNFRLSDFQLNVGYKALTFVPEMYWYDLHGAMRYYQSLNFGGVRIYANNVYRQGAQLAVPMRANPTAVKSNTGVTGLAADNSAGNAAYWQWDLQFTAGGTGVIDFSGYSVTLDAEL